MDDTSMLMVVFLAAFIPVCGMAVLGAVGIGFLLWRNARRAGDFKTRWAAIAQAHGLTLDPGNALQDPTLSGTVNGRAVTLTPIRSGLRSRSYTYTVAQTPASVSGELLIADQKRVHHVDGVSGAEVAITGSALAATHIVHGSPELAAALLTPDLTTRLIENAVSHVRVAEGQLSVRRPGHQSGEGECLALMQLAADLASRL